jgi:hypothetical protein
MPDAPNADGNTDGDQSAMDTDAGKRALAAERKRASDAEKRAADLEAELQKAKDKDKPDIERLTSERDAAVQRADKAEANVLRMEVAAAKGLTAAQAKRLTGSTKDELEADADELLEAFGGSKGGDGGDSKSGNDGQGEKPPAGKPREHMSGGNDPTTPPEETDPAKIAASIPRS